MEEEQKVKNKVKDVPIYFKQNLTITEAAEYSNIGINRLTMMVSEPNCPFVLLVGRKRLIKRKKFDEYIESTDML
jgi:excisionase family DNA binding protein